MVLRTRLGICFGSGDSSKRSAPVPGRSGLNNLIALDESTPIVHPTLLRPGTGALRFELSPPPKQIPKRVLSPINFTPASPFPKWM